MSFDSIPFDANNFTLTDQILGPLIAQPDFDLIPRMKIMGPLVRRLVSDSTDRSPNLITHQIAIIPELTIPISSIPSLS